jgi:hypothetical protein
VSGHSTFSAAGAEVLRRFSGSDTFGASYIYQKGRSKIEPGLTPRERLTLSWPTFTDAARQAGMSRRYRGIHFADADITGRKIGQEAAANVWNKAMGLINGEVALAQHSFTQHSSN